jgi:hypothetical protein
VGRPNCAAWALLFPGPKPCRGVTNRKGGGLVILLFD